MRVAAIQLTPRAEEDPRQFVDTVSGQIRELPDCDLVVLPELWHVGYFQFDRYDAEAQRLDGPLVTALQQLAAERRVHLHIGSILERTEKGMLANTSLLIAPDGTVLGTYRKVHVFGYQSREAELVQGGEDIVVAPVDGVPVGLAICYDLRFPELFRQLIDRGAEVLVVPATWPLARVEHWALLLRARAIENLAAVVGCNAAGSNGGVEAGGASAVIGPWGEVIAEAGRGQSVLTAVIDVDAVRAARKEFPALADRRIRVEGSVA